MKAFHKACGSTALEKRNIVSRGRDKVQHVCKHCNRNIEEQEIHHTDRRISAINYKGKAYVFGKEC